MSDVIETHDAVVRLDDILITSELSRRPSKPPNYEAENLALVTLAQEMANSHQNLLQRLVEVALELCNAGTAGISLLEDGEDGEVFRWRALAGEFAKYVGGTTPRYLSPCGTCLDRGAPQLYSYPARYFTYFDEVDTPIVEALIIPFYIDGQPLGTIWVVAHDENREFDREDARIMTSLATFTAAALKVLSSADTADRAALNSALTTERLQVEIEERMRAENDRENLLVSEKTARVEAELANHAKDQFFAIVSHELRTPLNSILAWLELTRRGGLNDADVARARETIERNAKSLAVIINDILEVSRITTGKFQLDANPVELAAVVVSAVDTVRPIADSKDIRLETAMDSSIGVIMGDSHRLHQVVLNLLMNAIKFTPKGGRVDVRLERVDSNAQLTVSDTGKGISAEFLPHIFDLFRQSDNSYTRAQGGLGLGLAIVQHFVEAHGGTIRAESKGADQGATFVVNLPLVMTFTQTIDSNPNQPSIEMNSTFDTDPMLHGVRVLVVDDQDDEREMLSIVLKQHGAELTAAASADEALALLYTSPEAEVPDVLITDIGMPGRDGYDLIRELRALEMKLGVKVPAVALTGYAHSDDRVKALSAGFQMHLAKPVMLAELVAVVANLAGRTQRGLTQYT